MIPDRSGQSIHIFHGYSGNNVVDRIKYITSVFTEDPQAFPGLAIHLFRGSFRKKMLGIHPAAPEYQTAAEIFFQHIPVHVVSGPLHRIENVKAGVNEHINDRGDTSAAMFEGFPAGILVNPVVDLLLVGRPHFLNGAFAVEKALLGSQVCAADVEYVN